MRRVQPPRMYLLEVQWREGESFVTIGPYLKLTDACREAASFREACGAHATRVEKWVRP